MNIHHDFLSSPIINLGGLFDFLSALFLSFKMTEKLDNK